MVVLTLSGVVVLLFRDGAVIFKVAVVFGVGHNNQCMRKGALS